MRFLTKDAEKWFCTAYLLYAPVCPRKGLIARVVHHPLHSRGDHIREDLGCEDTEEVQPHIPSLIHRPELHEGYVKRQYFWPCCVAPVDFGGSEASVVVSKLVLPP